MIELTAWIIGSFISLCGFTYLYYKFIDAHNFLNVRFMLSFVASTVVLAIVNYYKLSLLNTILYFIICPILFYQIKYETFKKLIFYIFIIWFYAILLDLPAMLLTSILFYFNIMKTEWYLFDIFMSLVLFVMLFVYAHNNKCKKLTKSLYEKISKVKFFDYSLFLFTIFIFLVGVLIFMNLKHLKISFLLSIIGSLVIVMFIILIKYRINMNENQIFLKTLKDNNDFYIQKEDENRIFKHNLNAKLLSIKSISNAKSKILIDDLLKENNHYSMVPDEIKVMPYGLNGIIYEKIYPYLEVLNIKIDNNIDYDIFVVLKPRRYNVLVEKLIVALDNAIEACLKSKDKALLISLFSENSSIVIEIKNTFSNNINLDNFGSKGYSTKGNKRGLGLFSVFRNNEVSLVIKIHNDLFITTISARKNY